MRNCLCSWRVSNLNIFFFISFFSFTFILFYFCAIFCVFDTLSFKHNLHQTKRNEQQQKIKTNAKTKQCFNQWNCFDFSYHQKYYLQTHKNLAEWLGLDSKLLQTSHVAARLNGYLVGVGGVQQFDEESCALGLTPIQREYVRRYVEENEGGSLYC